MWRTRYTIFTVLMKCRYRSHVKFEMIIRSVASACFTQTNNRGLNSQRLCTTQENHCGWTSQKDRYVPVYKTELKCQIREMSTAARNFKIDSVLQKVYLHKMFMFNSMLQTLINNYCMFSSSYPSLFCS